MRRPSTEMLEAIAVRDSLLVVGALAVVRYAVRNGTRRPWLVQLLARRAPKVAAVALAIKTVRMVWAS